MRVKAVAAALAACVISAIPALAWADTAAALTPEEKVHDQEIINRLGQRRLAYGSQRVAAPAVEAASLPQARDDYQVALDDFARQRADYLSRRNAYESSLDRYAEERRAYEARLAGWSQSVAACEAGDTAACQQR